jgi:hypothetical protein
MIMSPILASLTAVLALAAGASAAHAETVIRFPPKGGIPYAVQVPDRPNATSRRSTITDTQARTERRNGRRVLRPDR